MISNLAKQHYLSFLLGRKVISSEREFFLKSLQELKQEKGDFEKCCEILKNTQY